MSRNERTRPLLFLFCLGLLSHHQLCSAQTLRNATLEALHYDEPDEFATASSSNAKTDVVTICVIVESDSYFTSMDRMRAVIDLSVANANAYILPKSLRLRYVFQSGRTVLHQDPVLGDFQRLNADAVRRAM